MMKNAITEVITQPTMTSMRDSAYSLAVIPFLHHCRLQVELHPGRDGGSHHADQHVDVAGLEQQHRRTL
jgi:hypothetical protein